MKDNVNSEGRFILGSGSVEGKVRYYYYIQDGVGYRIKDIGAEGLLLIEDQDKTAYLSEYKSNNRLRWFGIETGTSRDSELHIPKGTIIKGIYELDLQ